MAWDMTDQTETLPCRPFERNYTGWSYGDDRTVAYLPLGWGTASISSYYLTIFDAVDSRANYSVPATYAIPRYSKSASLSAGRLFLLNSSVVTIVDLHSSDSPADFAIRRAASGSPSHFMNTATGQIDSVAWEFGDGDSAWGESVFHTFAEPGDYLVVERVYRNQGFDVQEKRRSVTITPGPCGDPTRRPFCRE